MPIITAGITALKPIGGVLSNNNAMSDVQNKAAAQQTAERAAKHQEKLDAFINKVVDNQRDQNNTPRWTVPFKN
jgi:hypothetical protein